MLNYSLKILFLANGIFSFAGSMLGPLFAVFVENFDKNILSVSLTWATFLFSATVFTYVISLVGDKIKEKEYLLMAGFLVRAVVWGGLTMINSLWLLAAAQILLGLGEALGSPAFDSIFAEHLDRNKHVREFSDWKLIYNLTMAAGTILGGLLAVKFGFNALFLTMSFLAISSFTIVWRQPRRML